MITYDRPLGERCSVITGNQSTRFVTRLSGVRRGRNAKVKGIQHFSTAERPTQPQPTTAKSTAPAERSSRTYPRRIPAVRRQKVQIPQYPQPHLWTKPRLDRRFA